MWDDICEGCALCCYERTVSEDHVIIDLSSPCRFLDEATKRCTVYKDRTRLNKSCSRLTPLHAMFSSCLPPSCAYIRWAEDHHIRFRKGKEMVLES